jgi:hypothetical protein
MAPIGLQREIARISLELSRERKCRAIVLESNVYYFLDAFIPSSAGEMQSDWHHACVCLVDSIMTGTVAIESLEPSDFLLLDNVWIDDLKRHLAFCYWLESHSDDNSSAFRERQYFRACETLRARLVDPRYKASQQAHGILVKYLQNTYLGNMPFQAAAMAALIASKAKRLSSGSQDTARTFVNMFYPNIIGAMSGDDKATLTVLKALQLGGGVPSVRPEIVSGFEAMLAVRFLDASVVTGLWANGSGETSMQTTF